MTDKKITTENAEAMWGIKSRPKCGLISLNKTATRFRDSINGIIYNLEFDPVSGKHFLNQLNEGVSKKGD